MTTTLISGPSAQNTLSRKPFQITPFQEHVFGSVIVLLKVKGSVIVLLKSKSGTDQRVPALKTNSTHRCPQNVDPRQHFKRTTSCVLAPGSSLFPEPAALYFIVCPLSPMLRTNRRSPPRPTALSLSCLSILTCCCPSQTRGSSPSRHQTHAHQDHAPLPPGVWEAGPRSAAELKEAATHFKRAAVMHPAPAMKAQLAGEAICCRLQADAM